MRRQPCELELLFDVVRLRGSENGALRTVRASLAGELRCAMVGGGGQPSDYLRTLELLEAMGEHCIKLSLKLILHEFARGLDALRMKVAVVATGGLLGGKGSAGAELFGSCSYLWVGRINPTGILSDQNGPSRRQRGNAQG